jgi:hypothetical protein
MLNVAKYPEVMNQIYYALNITNWDSSDIQSVKP